jgi:hypothetical protein
VGLFSFPISNLLPLGGMPPAVPAPNRMIVEDYYKLKHQIRDAWKAVGRRRDGLRELNRSRGNFPEAAIGEATIVRRTPETKKQGAPQFLWYVKDLHVLPQPAMLWHLTLALAFWTVSVRWVPLLHSRSCNSDTCAWVTTNFCSLSSMR